jgi:hypothetical protein
MVKIISKMNEENMKKMITSLMIFISFSSFAKVNCDQLEVFDDTLEKLTRLQKESQSVKWDDEYHWSIAVYRDAQNEDIVDFNSYMAMYLLIDAKTARDSNGFTFLDYSEAAKSSDEIKSILSTYGVKMLVVNPLELNKSKVDEIVSKDNITLNVSPNKLLTLLCPNKV